MATSSEWSQPTAYERWYVSPLGQAYAASLGRILQPWLASSAGQSVLDIGCGPGLVMERLFPPDARITGMDCSFEMARRALDCSERASHPRPFLVGSVARIPLADGSFDMAFCINCLEFVEDRAAAFAEIARILPPAGSAILGVLNRKSVWEWTRHLRRPFTRKPYYRGRFFSIEELQHSCAQAGLAVEETRTAVHFPPLLPRSCMSLYDRLDRRRAERGSTRGAVILCRARRPA